jgi:hypothetical protein
MKFTQPLTHYHCTPAVICWQLFVTNAVPTTTFSLLSAQLRMSNCSLQVEPSLVRQNHKQNWCSSCFYVPSSEANWHYLRVHGAVSNSSSYGWALLCQQYFKTYCRHLTHSSWLQYYLFSTGTRLWFGQLVDSSISTGTRLCFGQLVDSSFSTGTRLWFGQMVDSPFSTWTRLWFGQLVDSSFGTGTRLWLDNWKIAHSVQGLDYGLDSC